MKQALFWTFLIVFALTVLATLLGIAGALPIQQEYLQKLFYALLVESGVSVVALFKKTDFFGPTRLPAFEEIHGCWWELNRNHPNISLSFVRIFFSPDEQQLVIQAEAFDSSGKRTADWKSVATSPGPVSRKLYYFWEGSEESKEEMEFSGIGCFQFHLGSQSGNYTSGDGWFTTGNLFGAQVTAKHKVDLRRLSPDEEKAMTPENDAESKAALIGSVYSEWREGFSRSGKPSRP